MKVRVRYLIQDPQTAAVKDLGEALEWYYDDQPFLLDGPVCGRVAVLDFDETTGELSRGNRLLLAAAGKPSTYEIADETAFAAPDFIRVNAFATVLATLKMYEEADTLGREVRWAFDGPQLLVVPRAGEWANAFYERESRSLQFFYFATGPGPGDRVYTALSQDVIAHETGHALLDGIAPDLYNCLTPQSLALHEGIADLTALLVALRSRRLQEKLLAHTGGTIRGKNALSGMAEQFGFARARGRRTELRSMWNEKTLDAEDDSVDDDGEPTTTTPSNAPRRRGSLRSPPPATASTARASTSSGWCCAPSTTCRRGRSRSPTTAARSSPPTRPPIRRPRSGATSWVRDLVRRGVVDGPERLAVETGFEAPEVRDLDLDALAASDWAAYDFANKRRAFLGIPEGRHFRVRPRLDVAKQYYLGGEPTTVRECIVKVSWDLEEPNPLAMHLTRQRQITVGATLALDWQTRRVRALLRSQAASRPPGADEQTDDRNAMLTRLVESAGCASPPAGGVPVGSGVRAETSGDLMRIRGSGRLLHVAAEEA